MMKSTKKAVLVARSNHERSACNDQVRILRAHARKAGIKVVGKLLLPHCSANSDRVEADLMAMISRQGHDNINMIIVTDLSRLSRRGICHAIKLLQRLSAAGVSVVTPKLGMISKASGRAFGEPSLSGTDI